MASATINGTTFTLKQGATAVPGAVTYTGVTAVFRPTATLLPTTVYTATITTGAKDPADNALARDYIWSFTTDANQDLTPPTVSITSPTASAVDVPTNRQISVGFSEAMDPASITGTSFTVTDAVGVNVAGTVTSAGPTATFTPTVTLLYKTTYTVTVTTGVKDLAGNPLAANFVFTFTTSLTPDITAPVVTFTAPTNGQTAVPINRKINVAFSEGMDPLTITTETFIVTPGGAGKATSKSVGLPAGAIAGTVTTFGSTITFTPSIPFTVNTNYTATITTGVKDLAGNAMQASYSFIFTTTNPDVTPPTVSVTSPTNTAIDVPINRKVNVAFSEEMDPLTITTATVKMTGPGLTPVPGTVSYIGTTATFSPRDFLANSTLYTATITTGVKDLAGNAMTTNDSFTFTTGAAPDTTPPTVSFTSPTNRALDIAINRKVNVAFSEAMDPLTITAATITVTGPGVTPVSGTVSGIGTTATFVPSIALANSTLYSVTVTPGVMDLAGNALATNFVSTFTTGAAPDTTSPTVSVTSPANGDIDVPINRTVSIGFSEAMNPLTINTATITVTGPGVTPVPGTVSGIGTTATFVPSIALANSTLYTVTVTPGVMDLAGNGLATNFVSTFTTGAAPDNTPPTGSVTSPANGSIDVPINRIVQIGFSEAMDPLTINTASITMKATASGTNVPGAVVTFNTSATFTPLSSLAFNTNYTVTVTTAAKDLAGNALATDYVFTFTTGAGPDTTPPTVIFTDP